MPGRRWLVAAGAACLVAGLVVGRAVVGRSCLEGDGGNETTTGTHMSAGERVVFPFGGLGVRCSTVRIRSVRITGKRGSGVRVVGVYAMENGLPGGVLNDLDPQTYARLRPVTDAVFHQGPPPERWAFVVIVEGAVPGEWMTSGFDVSWRAGWRRGTTHYDDRLKATVP